MPDYKEMYNKLCHAQAKLDYLLKEANSIIAEVHQETERMYLEAKEPITLLPNSPEESVTNIKPPSIE